MTGIEMATEFLKNMNPNNNMDTADFRTYEIPLNERFNIEIVFCEEEFDDELKQRVAIDLVTKRGDMFDYTFAETTTDAQAIADGIDYILDKWHDRIFPKKD